MNICNHGVYFRHRSGARGSDVQVHLKMPREVIGDDVTDGAFTGASRMSNVGASSDKLGVGVQFSTMKCLKFSL